MFLVCWEYVPAVTVWATTDDLINLDLVKRFSIVQVPAPEGKVEWQALAIFTDGTATKYIKGGTDHDMVASMVGTMLKATKADYWPDPDDIATMKAAMPSPRPENN